MTKLGCYYSTICSVVIVICFYKCSNNRTSNSVCKGSEVLLYNEVLSYVASALSAMTNILVMIYLVKLKIILLSYRLYKFL